MISPAPTHDLGSGLHVLPATKTLSAWHTRIRDRSVSRADFRFYAERIIDQLLLAGLELCPHTEAKVETPTGNRYEGHRLSEQVCCVAVMRAADSMEGRMRALCPEMPVGKMLLQRDKVTKLPRFYYANLPGDIADRHVLLLDPMLATGGTARAAIAQLLQAGVREDRIIFVNVLCAPEGVEAVARAYPRVRMVTSSLEQRLNAHKFMVPGIGDFGDRFFGTVPPPCREE